MTPPVPDGGGTWAGAAGRPGTRWAWVALGFVVASLLALVLMPHWVGTRTQSIRQEIRTVVEPARAEADRMITHLDRQVAAIRGYRLSGADHHRQRYDDSRAVRLDAANRLGRLAERLGPPVPALLAEFDRAARDWEAAHQPFLEDDAPPEPPPDRAVTREDRYEAAIAAGERLQETLRQQTSHRRQAIQREESWGRVLAAALGLLALAAAVVVAIIAHRLRVYGREAHAELEERRRAEQALQAEEARFRALADNIPQLAWMADPGGAIFWYNRRWHEYTGTTLDEATGWGWTAVHHPDHVDRVVERFRDALQEERRWEDTFPLRGADGEYRWFLSRAVPIRDDEGRLTLWFGTNTDITEQREAAAERDRLAREVDRQRRLLQTVTDNATSALAMMDTDGRGTFWNPAAERMTGYSAEEVIGRTLHELIHHTHPDGTPFPIEECPIDLALPQGVEVEAYEDVFIRKNGEFFPVVCAAKPIVEDGRPAGTVLEVRDVTRERQAEEALRRTKEEAEASNRAKTDFLATMSHELRTPLNAILGFTDLLVAGVPDRLPERARSQVRRIDASARHLLRIIEEILTFSRVDARQETVAREPVDLREVVRSALAMTRPLADRKGLRIESDLDRAPETLHSDAQKLRQILVNLIGNAIKFTEEGSVEVSARTEDRSLVLQVRDTGIGIAPENLGRIFEPFWQVDQSHTRAAGGTGLGLAVSRSLARLLGGDIAAESRPGRGSTFELRLPLRSPAAVA